MSRIDKVKFPNFLNKTLNIPELLKFDINVTDLHISHFGYDSSNKLVDLVGHDEALFSIRDLHLLINANYQFISDPPLLADIGLFKLDMHNVTFLIRGITEFVDDMLAVNLSRCDLELNPYTGGIFFEGISDTSDVISRFATFVANILGGRLTSLSHYPKFVPTLNRLVNGLIGLIPDEIDIPWTNLYLEGGLTQKLEVVEHSFLELPLDASLQNRDFPYSAPNLAVFPDTIADDYQI